MWQFGLFLDGNIWRCKGRLENAEFPYSARHPALLPNHHPLTVLIIRESHERVMHNGVKETLAEARSKYWIIHGRQIVRQVLLKCVICRQYEGLPQPAPRPPPLPQFRVREEPAFTYVGLDFTGPLYVKIQGLVTRDASIRKFTDIPITDTSAIKLPIPIYIILFTPVINHVQNFKCISS